MKTLIFICCLSILVVSLKEVKAEEDESAPSCIGNDCFETHCTGDCDKCPSGRCCDGTFCNICHGNACCTRQRCNTCFKDCRFSCQRGRCYHGCYNDCLKRDQEGDIHILIKPPSSKKRFNVTTYINITNLVNSTNEIDFPITANNTNRNNVLLNYTIPTTKAPKRNGDAPQRCCIVIFPPQCYNMPSGLVCHSKKKKECSNAICVSSFVHLNHPPSYYQHPPAYLPKIPGPGMLAPPIGLPLQLPPPFAPLQISSPPKMQLPVSFAPQAAIQTPLYGNVQSLEQPQVQQQLPIEKYSELIAKQLFGGDYLDEPPSYDTNSPNFIIINKIPQNENYRSSLPSGAATPLQANKKTHSSIVLNGKKYDVIPIELPQS